MKRKSTLTNKNNKKIKITKNLENQEKSVSEDNTMINIMNSLQKCIYKCSECNLVCFNKMSHLIEKHFDELINCPHCSQSISVKDFENHFQICQPLIFECAFCDQTFPTKKICVTHSDNCPNREKFGISCVNASENNEKPVKNIEDIENLNVANKAVVNDNCSRSTGFIERCEMSPSVTTKINEEKSNSKFIYQFICSFCSMKFTEESQLKYHNQIENVAWNCIVCDAIFPSKCCIEEHLKTFHGLGNKNMRKFISTNNLTMEQIKTYNDVRKMMKNTINSELNEENNVTHLETEWTDEWENFDEADEDT